MAARARRSAARDHRLSSLTRLTADWYWEQDTRYRLIYMSQNIADKTGIDPQAYLGRTRWDWPALNLTEVDWARHRAQLERRETFRDFELHRLRSGGRSVWLSISGEPVFDSKGRFRGYRGIGRDITERKRAEDDMRRFRLAMDASADMIALIDRATMRYVDVNHTICRLLGYSRDELLAMGPADLIPEPREELERAYGALIASPCTSSGIKSTYRCKDGSRLPFESTRQVHRSGERWIIVAISRDIREKIAAETALQHSEERFRELAELSSDWYWEQDEQFRFVSQIGEEVRHPGTRPGRYVGLTRWEAHSASLTPQQWAAHRALLEAHQPFHDFEYERPGADGKMHWVSVSGRPVFDREGRFRGYRGVGKDITARKLADQALRESEERFRSLTDLSSDWYWEQDTDYRFTRMEGRHVAGGDASLRGRLVGKRRWESGLKCEGGWDAHIAVLEARKPFHDVLMWRELEDGSVRYLSVSGEPLFSAEGRFAGYRGVGRDVSAEKRAEQMLRLEHQIASALSEAEDERAGVRAVLRGLCEAGGWACGRYFAVDEPHGVLRFYDGFCADPVFQKFLDASSALSFAPGSGLAGRVWHTGEPVWSADTRSDPRVQAKQLASDSSARGAFAFAVASEGRRIGVIGITSGQVRQPDERLLQAARVIGGQLGQFLQRKRAEEALRESEARFRSLTQMSSDFFWETDSQHRFTQFVHGSGYQAKLGKLILGKAAWDLPSTSPDEAGWANLRATVEARLPFREFEFGRPRPQGSPMYFSVSGEPRFAADGAFFGYRGVGREITEVVLAREHVASLAYNDPLTGLANRTSLGPAFEQAIERARRRGDRIATMFVDLDGFKQVNDVHGHEAGDRFLAEIARRLRGSLRASDLVARIGGDEFFVVLEDQQEAEAVETVARKLLLEVVRPYEAAPGADVSVSASIGISVFPADAQDAATLMKHADRAMYQAKQAGKNAFRFYGEKAAEAVRAPTGTTIG